MIVHVIGETGLLGSLLVTKLKQNHEFVMHYFDNQSGDEKYSYADITKKRQELEYNPQFSIGEELDKFLHWDNSSQLIIPYSKTKDLSKANTIRKDCG